MWIIKKHFHHSVERIGTNSDKKELSKRPGNIAENLNPINM
jgi:hypothetical protein